MPEQDAELTDFIKCLTELADYKEYFEKEENYQTLVDWLHHESGINKFVIRKALKHIAPLVISTLAKKSTDSGGKLYAAGMNKLHDRLGNYAWYRETCQRLLNTLKKRTDKSYGQMLDNPGGSASADKLDRSESPDRHTPQELLKNQGKWSNLNDQQKATVQLLIGQQTLDANDQQILTKVEQLFSVLSREPELDTPEFILEEFLITSEGASIVASQAISEGTTENTSQVAPEGAKPGSISWLTYGSRKSRFLGRDHEMGLLKSFLTTGAMFSWCCITGPGGTGKSRLGLEFMLASPAYWQKGFLPQSEFKRLIDNNWVPDWPTLLIVDYGAQVSESLTELIDKLIKRQAQFDYPVRLLILERYFVEQDWWNTLVRGDSRASLREKYLYLNQPIELPAIPHLQQAILASFLAGLDYHQGLPDIDTESGSLFWDKVRDLSLNGSPLFLGMIAVAIFDNGIGHIREWQRDDLLNHLYLREKNNWLQQLSDFNKVQQEQIIELMLFATLVQGFDVEQDAKPIQTMVEAAGILNDTRQLGPYWRRAKQLSGQNTGVLIPDIFAEYVLMKHWAFEKNGFNDAQETIMNAAFAHMQGKVLQIVNRCAIDFPKSEAPFNWWNYLWQQLTNNNKAQTDSAALDAFKANETNAEQQKQQKQLQQKQHQNSHRACFNIGMDIVGQLSLAGRSDIALQSWLPALQNAEEPKDKARVTNQIGEQYLYLAEFSAALPLLNQSLKIQQDIGDKAGEGATLNNISQIYDAQGDYSTALDYLKRSLNIMQDIGDKAGEGTTLNNISTIYDAQGDYSTALDYLKRSLNIRQDIGDKAGEGATLNNISQIYDAQGDYSTALDYLKRSLNIMQDIGDKAGEGATLNNISQIYIAQGDYSTALDYLKRSLDIQQDIGDKAGEGTTLNNISQIYIAQGDYSTALDYLKRSLDIQQDIGDKAGEGATLNNISQIYDAQGDYSTALDYLNRSLNIRQDIGDSAGLCATLFNIGHIHLQKKESNKAVDCWLSVYIMAKPMKLAQVLKALENLAPQLGIEDGLEGWEKLYQQNIEKTNKSDSE